jgi:hypothetical protein
MGAGFCARETAVLQAVARGQVKGSKIAGSEATERDIGAAHIVPRG